MRDDTFLISANMQPENHSFQSEQNILNFLESELK